MTKHLVLIMITLLTCQQTHARERPAWIDRRPPADRSYRYYTGIGTNSKDEQSGRSQAYRSAITEFAKELGKGAYGFGAESAVIESLTYHSSNLNAEEKIGCFDTHGFEEIERYIEEGRGDGLTIHALYRVTNVQFETAASEVRNGACLGSGNSISRGNGVGEVSIKTVPRGAKIMIDGESFGFTDLDLNEQLAPGEHELILDEPYHLVVKRLFSINAGEKLSIHEVLIPATGRYEISTEPDGAEVIINGQSVGTSPIFGELQAGHEHKLKFLHKHALPLETRISLGRDQLYQKTYNLSLKPALLTIRGLRDDINVSLDSRIVSSDRSPASQNFTLSSGDHTLRISKPGYKDNAQKLVLEPDEKRTVDLAGISLAPIPPREVELLSPPFTLGITAAYRAGIYSNIEVPMLLFGAMIEHRPLSWLGIKFDFAVGKKSIEFSDADLSVNRSEWGLGFPLYPLFGLYIEPKAGLSGTYNEITKNSTVSTSPTHWNPSLGVQFGYQILKKPEPKDNAVWGVNLFAVWSRYFSLSSYELARSWAGGMQWIIGF